MTHLDLTTYLKDKAAAIALAAYLNTSVIYLRHHVATGRKKASAEYAYEIEKGTNGVVLAESVCPTFPWAEVRGSCPKCQSKVHPRV